MRPGGWQASAFRLGQKLLLACHHLVAQGDQIDIGLPALGEHAFRRHFFFMHMMLDLFRQYLDLRIIIFSIGRTGRDIIHEHLGAVMLDIGLVERVIFDLSTKSRVENLLLDHRMDLEFGAYFLCQGAFP